MPLSSQMARTRWSAGTSRSTSTRIGELVALSQLQLAHARARSFAHIIRALDAAAKLSDSFALVLSHFSTRAIPNRQGSRRRRVYFTAPSGRGSKSPFKPSLSGLHPNFTRPQSLQRIVDARRRSPDSPPGTHLPRSRRRPPEDTQAMPRRPIGDRAGFDNVASARLGAHPNGSVEVNLSTPVRAPRVEWKGVVERVRRRAGSPHGLHFDVANRKPNCTIHRTELYRAPRLKPRARASRPNHARRISSGGARCIDDL